MRRLVVWLLVSCWFLASAVARGGDLRVGPVFTDALPAIEVVVEAPSDRNRPDPLPDAPSLTLIEDGTATVAADAVRPFRDTGRGMAIVLVCDTSGTMAGPPVAAMKRAISRFLDRARPEDRIALVTFAGDVRVEAPFGAPPEQLRAAVAGLAPRGRTTELYRALFKAFALFDAPDLPERRRLVVLSDGKDEGAAYRLDDVVERGRQLEVPIDAVGLSRIGPQYLSVMERMADLTGGRYAQARRPEDLESIFGDGIDRLQATPVALFTPKYLKADAQTHRVGVRLRAGDRALEGETQSVFPEPAAPTAAPARPGFPFPVWLALSALGAFVAVGLLAFSALKRKRRRVAAPVPSGTTPTHPSGHAATVLDDPRPGGRSTNAFDPPIPTRGGARVEPLPARQTRIRAEAGGGRRPAVVLTIEAGPAAGSSVSVTVDPFWIGAQNGSALNLGADPYVSGRHACIRFDGGLVLIADNKSTNGTMLNGARLGPMPALLNPGDRIRIGDSVILVSVPTSDHPR